MIETIEVCLRMAIEHSEVVAAAMRDLGLAGAERAREHAGLLSAVLGRFLAGETLASDYDAVRDARAFFLSVYRQNQDHLLLAHACEGVVVAADVVLSVWSGKSQVVEARKETQT